MNDTFWIGIQPSLSNEHFDFVADKLEELFGLNLEKVKMSTVLITGINGFLGNLAKMLSSKFKVIGLEYSLDNLLD